MLLNYADAAMYAAKSAGRFQVRVYHRVGVVQMCIRDSPALHSKMQFDTLTAFAPVSLLLRVPNVLVVTPSYQVKTVADLIRLGQPDSKEHVYFASAGPGSAQHLAGELFNPVSYTHLLRLLAVTTPQRVPQAPEIPAVGELGYPGLVAENFVGLSGPAGLPDGVSERLHAALAQVLQTPELRAKLEGQGFVLAQKSSSEFTDFVRRQAEAWGPAVSYTHLVAPAARAG